MSKVSTYRPPNIKLAAHETHQSHLLRRLCAAKASLRRPPRGAPRKCRHSPTSHIGFATAACFQPNDSLSVMLSGVELSISLEYLFLWFGRSHLTTSCPGSWDGTPICCLNSLDPERDGRQYEGPGGSMLHVVEEVRTHTCRAEKNRKGFGCPLARRKGLPQHDVRF